VADGRPEAAHTDAGRARATCTRSPKWPRPARKLGYRVGGIEHHVVRGRPALTYRLRLTRTHWEAARSVPVEIEGLTPCLPLFGVPE
jgi:hypothetical protein